MTLFSIFKSVKAVFDEIKNINTTPSLCVIKERQPRNEKDDTYFKFDILGSSLTLKMKASDIAKNRELLERFSFKDKSDIIFYSGLCSYKLIDITLDGTTLFTISATFDSLTFMKKFSVNDINKHKQLIKKLKKEEQTAIYSIIREEKIIYFDMNARLNG